MIYFVNLSLRNLSNNSTIDASDLIIKNTKSQKNILMFGRGITIQNNSRLNLKRSEILNNREIGLISYNNCNIELDNVLINETYKNECSLISPDSELYCGNIAVGFGLGIIENSNLKFNKLKISNNSVLGVQLVGNSNIVGDDMEISYNPIGFNIQGVSEDFKLTKNVTGLIMRNNKTNFDSQELQVPGVIEQEH